MHVQAVQPPTATLTSVGPPVTNKQNKPDEQPMQTVQVGRLSLTVPADDSSKDAKKNKKEDSELPECTVD